MPRDPEVNIKIKADARELRKLRQEGKQAFDKQTIREFTRASTDMERQLGEVLKKQIKLTAELKGVEKGTKAYKQLKDELKGVNQEATQVERTLGRVRQVIQRQQVEQDRMRQRRQGFIGGMGQGLGVAQYIPTGAEMMPRMAGAMIGGGIRRMGGAAAAPFMTPGVGGMIRGVSGIPLIGGFVGGAMQTAAGAYQQAVQYQRLQRQMIQFAGAGMGRQTVIPGVSRAQAEAAQRRVEEGLTAVRQSGAVLSAGAGTGGVVVATPASGDPQRAQAAMRLREKGYQVRLDETGLTDVRRKGGRWGDISGATTEEMKDIQTMIATGPQRLLREGTVTVGGERVQATTAEANRLKGKQREAAIQGRMRKARIRTETGLPGLQAGVPFGMGPTEMMQMFGQFMGARGGVSNQVERAQFMETMAAQTRFGVTGQQAGAFARMGVPGGGGQGAAGLAGVLRSAFVQGLHGAQITEYLQSLVQLGQQAERMGVKINEKEFVRSAATLSAAGLQGLQAQRVATGMQQAAIGVSQRGVQSPIDVMIARAAGFDPSQGPEGYARAMNKISGGMTSDMMNKLMSNLTRGAGAGGFGPEMQALMLRRAMGRMGVQVGPGQASKMLASYREGSTDAMMRELEAGALIGRGEQPGARRWLRGEAVRGVRAVAGITPGAAGLEAGQIGVGMGAARWVQALERSSLNAAKAIGNLPLVNFAKAVERSTNALNKFMSGGEEASFLDLMRDLINAIRGIGSAPASAG
jgi:hypothetical protein